MGTSILYPPGRKRRALRSGPNSFRCCTAYTLSICACISFGGMDGLKTWTFGPKSGVGCCAITDAPIPVNTPSRSPTPANLLMVINYPSRLLYLIGHESLSAVPTCDTDQ